MSKNEHTERLGGPGSSHQDRQNPGKNHQPSGKKGGGRQAGSSTSPGEPTNSPQSRISGGGGERDSHHTHTDKRS
jgi:hypothetical protein